MSRYSVHENAYGYDIHSSALRFAVVDNEPAQLSVYSPVDRTFVLRNRVGAIGQAIGFRAIAYCKHMEDAEALAKALNEMKS